MATYKPYKKTTDGKEEIKIPYSVLSNPPDLSVYAKLAGNNTFTGGQTITGANNGYSINASGYIKGSWLQASAISNKGANTGKVCVFDDNGWIYYRTPAEILTEAGGAKASDVSGKANLSGGNTFTGDQHFNAGYYGFEVSNSYDKSFIIEDPVGNYFIAANTDGFSFDDDQLGNYPFLIGGEAGTSGQVITSQGAGKTPLWTTPAIKSATLTGTTLYLTL